MEIDVKEIKDAVSERLIEIGSYFKDTGFTAELDEKLGNVTYLIPATLWNVDVEVFYEEH